MGLVVIQTGSSFAADNTCQQQFGLNVASCMQSINPNFLTPKEQADARKACVDNASATKKACESGIPQCLQTCQNTYDSSALTCEQNYDPSSCGGDLNCEINVLNAQALCIFDAAGAFNSCTAACQQ